MFHEEKLINGTLYWRGTPDGIFFPYSIEALTKKLIEAREEAKKLRLEKITLEERSECLSTSPMPETN